MRKLLLAVLIAASTYGIAKAQTNYQYGPTYENYFTGAGDIHAVGDNSGYPPYILFLNWQWGFTNIPTSATLESVEIKFEALTETYGVRTLPFTLHFIQSNWIDFNNSDLYTELQNGYNGDSITTVLSASIISNSSGIAEYDGVLTSGALFDSVQAAMSSGRYYMTIAMRSEDGSSPWWEIYPYNCNTNTYWDSTYYPCVSLTIKYQASTETYQFSNEIEGTTNYGSLNLKNDQTGAVSPVNSGSSVGLAPTNTYSATTAELPFLPNWNGSGYTEKHQYWVVNQRDTNILSYDLQPDLNHTARNLTAQFGRTYPVTIENNVDGGTAGVISFDDPWHYYSVRGSWLQNNQMIQYNSPLSIQNNSGSYGGVILNQSYSVPGKPYYSVSVPATQTATIDGASHTLYFQNWSASGATLESPNSTQTAVVFNQTGATVSANLKGTHLSSDPSAFTRGSQRRFIQTMTPNGTKWLHQVYTSGGHVWIEHSSDDGNTWTLGNGGQPLDGTAGGKCPSIAYLYYSTWGNNYIGVVWQQQYGSTYTIQGEIFNQMSGGTIYPTYAATLYTEQCDSYSINANPNIILSGYFYSIYFVTFERKSSSGTPGINWLIGLCGSYGGGQEESFPSANPPGYAGQLGAVPGTNANSINAAIALDPYAAGSYSNLDGELVYQDNYDPQLDESQIRQTWFYLGSNNNGNSWSYSQYPTTPSVVNDYAPNDYNPSVILDAEDNVVACWIDNIPNNENGSWAQVDQMTFNLIGSSVFYYYGYGVQSCSINLADDNANDSYPDGFAVWCQIYNGTWSNQSLLFEAGTPNSNDFRTLTTSGKYIQLANGTDTKSVGNMYVSSFYPFTAPYYFATSQDLGSMNILFKTSPSPISVSRGCNISKGDANFTYRFGDLNVDGQDIDFIDAPDRFNYRNLDRVDSVLETRPFQVNPNSDIVFTERSGFSDSTSAIHALGDSGYVGYKVEAIDNATRQVLGTMREGKMTSSDLQPFKLVSYKLSTSGLAGKTVRIRVVVNTNLDSVNVSLAKSFALENVATESSTQSASLQAMNAVTTYALAQNYPNPFNPTTIFNYQLPVDGHVTLTVYDVLGRKVNTLVDEDKSSGSYEVNFDARNLASGVYFYRIDIHGNDGRDFSSIKKMLLLK